MGARGRGRPVGARRAAQPRTEARRTLADHATGAAARDGGSAEGTATVGAERRGIHIALSPSVTATGRSCAAPGPKVPRNRYVVSLPPLRLNVGRVSTRPRHRRVLLWLLRDGKGAGDNPRGDGAARRG